QLYKKFVWHFQDYFDLRNRKRISAVLDDARPDHVEVDNLVGFGFNILSEIGSRGIPVAYVLHDLNLVCFNTGMIRSGKICNRQCFSCGCVAVLRQKNLEKITRLGFISPSHANLERAKKYIPAMENSLSCVIRNVPEEIPKLPEKIKPAENRIQLLYVGR